ncbi:lactonase family protein [Amycolatopsis sp. NPDC059027]|uniref:lactonase family protein n=1 Tax=Amycolatopsis sp. NPDC059027 TaxID=3346709 RepID=UPI00366CDF6E
MDLVLVGGYGPTGIVIFRRSATGQLTHAGTLPMESPSWLTRHPALPMLYAANETADGAITSVRIEDSGTLIALDTVDSGGADPCHLAVTQDGRFLLCANYSSGSLAVFGLDSDGRITGRTDLVRHIGRGPAEGRQDSAHVHMAVPGIDDLGTIVSAVDLGTDEIRSYRLSPEGKLHEFAVSTVPSGTGPRQLIRRPGTDLAYVVGELAGTLVTMREIRPGAFEVVAVTPSTHAADTTPNLVAHVELDGDRLYLSSRGPDCVTEFTLDPAALAVTDHPSGAEPRHFALADGMCFVAAQNDDAITVFPLDGSGEPARYPTPRPSCVLFS